MAETILHKADSRGNANHGWLQSRHSFSFAEYYDAQKMNFGALRVLNDDIVAGGMGFGMHNHSNMEIISIPLSGNLEHADSMGNKAIIQQGDVQLMSAGKGVAHSEYNKSASKMVKFLQIWILPNQQNVEPRYDQISLNKEDRINQWQQIISPNKNDSGMWLHQNAWLSLGCFDANFTCNYTMKSPGNGVYVFVLSGNCLVENIKLQNRDALGVWDTTTTQIQALSANTEILLIEVPM